MIVEVFLDPNRDLAGHDPIIITQFNVSKGIKDSILVNFGDSGLASSLGSFQGSIKACRNVALKYDELKFEQYKLVVGACLAIDAIQHMQNCLDKIKVLEH
nr:putative ribonuclease p/mrp protein subunit pop5 [Quercus suber]